MPGKVPLDGQLVLAAGMRILEGTTKKATIKKVFDAVKSKLGASVRQKTIRRQITLPDGTVLRWSLWVGRFSRNPPWIQQGAISDTLWGYALILEYSDFVGVSASRVGDIAVQLGIPTVGWDLLVNFEATDSSEYLNVVLRNTKASTSGVQTRVLSGQKLERSISRVQTSRAIATRVKFMEASATWSISPATGGLSQQSPRIDLDTLCRWFARQTAALRAGGTSSSFMRGFAKRQPISLIGPTITPTALQFDVSVLTDALDEGGVVTRGGVQLTQAELDSLLARLRRIRTLITDGSGGWRIVVNKTKSLGNITVLKRRLGFSSQYLRSFLLREANGDEQSLLQLFGRKGSYLVTFSDPNFAYHLGELFEDAKVANGSNALLEMLDPRLPTTITSEKGNDGKNFEPTSLFGWLELNTKGRLVCEDMASEWADYISVNVKRRLISFFHAKFAKTAGVRASGLHEVVSQAVKNLGFATASKDELDARKPRWSGKWNKTKIARARRRTVDDFVDGFLTVAASPRAKTRIVVVTTALSRSAVRKAFAKFKAGKNPGVHATQLIWLLAMFADQCRQLSTEPVVYCLP